MTPGQALRRFCLECEGATNAAAAFDCLSLICPLFEAMPFRGKPMPKSMAVELEGEWAEWEVEIAKKAEARPRRRVGGRMLSAYCRNVCQPEDRTDCGGLLNPGTPQEHTCPLHAYHPYRPGGPRKARRGVQVSSRSLEALASCRKRTRTAKTADSEGQYARGVGAEAAKAGKADQTAGKSGMTAGNERRPGAQQITGPSPAARADAVAPAAKGGGPDSWSVEQVDGASPEAAHSG